MDMTLNIHPDIRDKLDNFIKMKKIPNIIFHGPSGSGKRTILKEFINKIYNNNTELIKSYVLFVNCAHGKGIKFIREDLKYFAKTHINVQEGTFFKSIILSNADKLTMDGQSALRRSIELFSHTTRFFIVVEDKYKLLKPILSRFVILYIHEPVIDGQKRNLHVFKLKQIFSFEKEEKKRKLWLKNTLEKNNKLLNHALLCDLSIKLYEKGYSGLDLMSYVENLSMERERKYKMLLTFHKVKKEFRNEKLLILFILNFVFLRSDDDLENISFM